MELEQRIRALELEMKILKNEVQRTLLDVQEQVLLNQRPIITIEPNPSGGKVRAIEPLRAQPPAAPTVTVVPAPPAAPAVPAAMTPPVAPAPTGSAVPPAPAVFTAPAAVPVLKKVSLEEIRAAQSELDAEFLPANSAAVDKLVELVQNSAPESDQKNNGDAATLAERGGVKLLEWLMSGATKVDGEHDEKRVMQVIDKLTQLNSLVDRASTMEEALRMIEEAKLG